MTMSDAIWLIKVFTRFTKGHSVAVSCYNVQVDDFVKCLKLVLVYRIFTRPNYRLQETKVLEVIDSSFSTNLKTLKVELLFHYKKSLGLQVSIQVFCKQFYKSTRARLPHILFLIIFSPGIFIFGIDSVNSYLRN